MITMAHIRALMIQVFCFIRYILLSISEPGLNNPQLLHGIRNPVLLYCLCNKGSIGLQHRAVMAHKDTVGSISEHGQVIAAVSEHIGVFQGNAAVL